MTIFKRYRPGVIWIGMLVALAVIWFMFNRTGDAKDQTTITAVVSSVRAGEVNRIIQSENSRAITIEYKDPKRRDGASRLPQDTNIFQLLNDSGVDPNS
ncbi:MAG TPA: hypothetical protein PK819_06315, partial [Thermomicrobiales bacterium]|nr:hypothetical protein [Thermomicrobiales bacterium]